MFASFEDLRLRREREDVVRKRTSVFDSSNSFNDVANFDNQFDEIIDEIVENSNEENVDLAENDVVVENDVVAQLNDQFRRDRERTSRDNILLRFNQSSSNIIDFNDNDHLFDSTSFDVQVETQIIFDDQIIDRRSSIFKRQKRNHAEIKDFLSKHEKFHVLNSHMINKNNVLIVIEQYFENKTIEWFIFLSTHLQLFDDKWFEFKMFFLIRWNEHNWQQKFLKIYNEITQIDAYNKIVDYNSKFTSMYENVHEHVIEFAIKKRYRNDFKFDIRNYILNQNQMYSIMNLHNMMTNVSKHENINVERYVFRVSRTSTTSQLAQISVAQNNKSQENLNVMNVFARKCYNCDQTNHLVSQCSNSHVSNHVSQDWRSRRDDRDRDKDRDSKNVWDCRRISCSMIVMNRSKRKRKLIR